ncbi:MAG: ABC transporter permease [Burkholderiaceae bacterium]|nr:ABC transporter permease [Microbacteriaceae bacterium]
MRRFFTGIVGAVVEARAELRIHRTRVLLSLIGVAVAITALTTVVGLGAIAQQSTLESMERGGGRAATLSAYTYSATGAAIDSATLSAAVETIKERYAISYSSTNGNVTMGIQFADGVAQVNTQLVDVDFATMHRFQVTDGSWFQSGDANRMAPALIVNEAFWQRIGSPDLRTHPTVTITGTYPTTGVIIGIGSQYQGDPSPSAIMLTDAYVAVAGDGQFAQQPPSYEFWVPEEVAEPLTTAIQRDLTAAVGDGASVSVNRNDYAGYGGEDPLLPVKLIVTGVAVLILFLGALSLVNISLVTVRQRIREIGIRRSFGASAGRVFFAVMMESVVGTFAAGVIGVFLAVLIVENPTVQELIAQGAADLPPFPIEAALIGLGAATAVGALAGLLPALVAVRVKVIDAIRY